MSAHVVLGLYAQVRRGHILDRARSADIPACDLYPVAPGDRARANEPRSALSHRTPGEVSGRARNSKDTRAWW